MSLQLVTAPAEEPVSLSEAKSHLRVDISDDDTLIGGLIASSREIVEQITRRALVTQTWKVVLDQFPAGQELALPLPPLLSVTSIIYTDKDGTENTFASSNYVVDTGSEPGRIVLQHGCAWPSVTLYPVAAVSVQYVAGYGAASDVPETIKHAMKLLIGDFYENRENTLIGAGVRQLPMSVTALLWPHRVLEFS